GLLRRRVPGRAPRSRTARQASAGGPQGHHLGRRRRRRRPGPPMSEAGGAGDPKDPPTSEPASYAAAGVDIEAGDGAVELMKKWVAKASRPEVVGGLGGFAGLFDASLLR